ncbi:MAG: ArsR/SmtB family transcription factor [Halodesulfurarchaeum sp.]
MASYIPKLQSSEPVPTAEPRVIALEGSEVDAVFETLSSETRRSILNHLYDSPKTPSELARETDTSLQNVHYHLEKLKEVDLVEPVSSRYSEKGKEMQVYGPAADPLIFVESEETRTQVKSKLGAIVGAVSLVVIASLVVQKITDWLRKPANGENVTLSATTFDAGQRATEGISRGGPDLMSQAQSALLEPGSLVLIGGLVALTMFLLVRWSTESGVRIR